MANRFVYGSYKAIYEAQKAVEDLVSNGIPEQSIALVGKPGVVDYIPSNVEVIATGEGSEPRETSLWEDIVGFFAPDTADYDGKVVAAEGYEHDIENGNVLVVVDNEYQALSETLGGTTMKKNDYKEYDEMNKASFKDTDLDGKETIQLHEERVTPRAESQVVGDVEITKEVIRDTKTVEVPVEKEVLNITRREVNEKVDNFDNDAFTDEKITIPLREDKVVLDKETMITEEVEIDKSVERSTQEYNQETRKEVLDIDKDSTIVERDNQFNDRDVTTNNHDKGIF